MGRNHSPLAELVGSMHAHMWHSRNRCTDSITGAYAHACARRALLTVRLGRPKLGAACVCTWRTQPERTDLGVGMSCTRPCQEAFCEPRRWLETGIQHWQYWLATVVCPSLGVAEGIARACLGLHCGTSGQTGFCGNVLLLSGAAVAVGNISVLSIGFVHVLPVCVCSHRAFQGLRLQGT
jgi:hypothetical protein